MRSAIARDVPRVTVGGMAHRPDRARFRAAVSDGANLVPVWRELVLDGDTPVSAFARLGGEGDGSFLLESVVGGEKWAAYSFIGISPRGTLRVGGGRARLQLRDVEGAGAISVEEWAERDPARALDRLLARFRAARFAELPRFFGGAVGCLAYDAVRAWEPVTLPAARAVDDLALPDALFVVSDVVVIFDNLRQTVKVCACASTERADADRAYDAACARVDAVVAKLRAPSPPLPMLDLDAPPPDASETPRSRTERTQFLDGVRRCQEHILAGDAFQIVLSQRFEAPRAGARPFDAYRALRAINPSPYMFHLALPGVTVTGASPETLVRLDEGRIEVRPIAGTRRRGADPVEDARLADELRADE